MSEFVPQQGLHYWDSVCQSKPEFTPFLNYLFHSRLCVVFLYLSVDCLLDLCHWRAMWVFHRSSDEVPYSDIMLSVYSLFDSFGSFNLLHYLGLYQTVSKVNLTQSYWLLPWIFLPYSAESQRIFDFLFCERFRWFNFFPSGVTELICWIHVPVVPFFHSQQG